MSGSSGGSRRRNRKTKTSECTPLLILSCLGSTIGTTVPVGYFLGVVNAPAQFVQEWMEAVFKNRGVSMDSAVKIEVLWAVIIAIYLVGGMIGSFVAAWYSDTFGRKGCILFSAILLLVAAMLMGFCRACNMVEMLFVGRLIAGIGSALIFTAQPMYLAELAPDSLRSIFGVFTCLGVTFGALIGALVSMPQLLGSSEHWPLAFSFYAIFIIIGFLPGYWYPESPRWLYVIKNNDIKALLVLERLRRTRAQVDMELNEMRTESQMYVKNENWITICKRKELLLPFVLVCSLQACQQMTGINAIFFYSISTFTGAGFSLTDAAFMNLGLSVFNLFAALFGSFFVHLYDRRRMLIISFSGLGCSLTGISFSLHYVNLFAWMPSVPIIFMATFVASFQLGIAQISYFIGSELFDVTPRPFAMSFGSFCNWFGNTLIGFCFPLLQHAIGSFAFMPCVVVCIYGICLVYFYLPETRGRDLTTIKQSMAKGAQRRCCGRKSSPT